MSNNAEIIRAITPIVLTISGVIVCAFALFAPGLSDTVRIGVATGVGGVAIGGAAGLSQSPKTRSSPTMSSGNVDTVNIEQPNH